MELALGDEIAEYFMNHAGEYCVMYLIWRQHTWMVDRDPVAPVSGQRMMGDRGDWTSNHMDHVHITLSTRGVGLRHQRRNQRASAPGAKP